MAKKKNKKAGVKQTSWTSPPPSPKQAPVEDAPALPTELPPTPAPEATDPIQNDSIELDSPSQSTKPEAAVEATPVETPAAELPPVENHITPPEEKQTEPDSKPQDEAGVPKKINLEEPKIPDQTETQENQEAWDDAIAQDPVPEEANTEVSSSTKAALPSVPQEPEAPPEPLPVSSEIQAPSEPEIPPSTSDETPKAVETSPAAPEPEPEPTPAILRPGPEVALEDSIAAAPEPEFAPGDSKSNIADSEPIPEERAESESTIPATVAPPAEQADPPPTPKPQEAEIAPEGAQRQNSPTDPKDPVSGQTPSAAPSAPEVSALGSPPPAPAAPPSKDLRSDTPNNTATTEPPQEAPRVKQLREARPPAPSPPINTARPHRAYEDDSDEDLPIIRRNRTRTTTSSRSRDQTGGTPPQAQLPYPPPHQQPRAFASRVPTDHYEQPPPPQQPRAFASRVPTDHYEQPPPAPPGYQQRYYGPTPPRAPPYYQNMSQNGSYAPQPNPYGAPPHGYSPSQQSWDYGQPYGNYGGTPPHRQDSIVTRDYPFGPPGPDNSAIEDEGGDIFGRISRAIPDLQVLLNQYRDTHGQLGMKEDFLRHMEAQQKELLRRKDDHIDSLSKELDALKKDSSTEANKHRFEINNMEEQMKELKDRVAEIEKYKKEVDDAKAAHEATKVALEAQKSETEKAAAEAQKTAAAEKERLQQDFEHWKENAVKSVENDKMALAVEFDKKLREQELIGENEKAKAVAEFYKEKDEIRSEHHRQQREREENFEKIRKELENKLSTAQKDREHSMKQERESREAWEHERDVLIKAHNEDKESLKKNWDEQRELSEAQYKKQKEESDKAWTDLYTDANKKADEEKAKAESFAKEMDELRKQLDDEKAKSETLTKERDELQKKFDAVKAENEKEKEVIKSVAGNLEMERQRLEKLVECYGDVTDIKSKGDTFYLDSFSQLSKQILDLSTTHFNHLPVTPPPDVLSVIPDGLPSFLGNTPASRQLRSMYVAHLVSSILTFRVFGPFLFSLGRRFDKADGLFLSMSNHLRGKNTRKEAIWRQHTLVAAFTSSDAKQRINSAAGSVVEEIVNAIKYFTDPKEEEAIRVAVRRIVKISAETWRFARLEREMITAKMPAVDDDSQEFNGPDFWPSYNFESSSSSATVSSITALKERPKMLLRLFPVISREAVPECFQTTLEEKKDKGCIYSHGIALYEDSKPVIARAEELRQAGLPPSTSPRAADFPPPMIPPPRIPPPPAPAVEPPLSRTPPPRAAPAADLPVSRTPPPRASASPVPSSNVEGAFARDLGLGSSTSGRSSPSMPTTPRSRPGTPPSPLFAAVDEIDGLRQHNNVNPRRPSSSSRRATGPIPLTSEDMAGVRRASGYSIGNRTSLDSGSSGKSGGTGGSGGRYCNESRSAAIKALYPNSPMGGGPVMPGLERANSLPVRSSSLRRESFKGERSSPEASKNETAFSVEPTSISTDTWEVQS